MDTRVNPTLEPIRVGVSSCLLGEEVRYDGGHKRDDFIAKELARFVELVPFCPEVSAGMTIPRPAIQLRYSADGPDHPLRVVDSKDPRIDHTQALRTASRKRTRELAGDAELCGYILKSKSPSCGLFRIPIHRDGTQPVREGRGIFADELTANLPLLPVEDEGRLNDPGLRENFVERVFAYARLRRAFAPRWRLRDLVNFHSGEKYLLLAHHPPTYKRLGKLVADSKQWERAALAEEYQRTFLDGMAVPAQPGRHVNVMQHMLGYFKEHLDSADRLELLTVMADYKDELVPLIVPVTLLRFFVRRHEVEYLARQSYLYPHPKELMLRNRR